MAENQEQGREPLWKFAEARGISRRHFLRLMAVGGATAVLAACAIPETPDATQPLPPPPADSLESVAPARFKDPSPFIVHDDKSMETRLENMQGLITPSRYFFVRNNSVSLDLNPDTWRLSIEGDAVGNPLELTYADILGLPSRVLMCYLECGGNHRAMFDIVQGRTASGTQWKTGGIGNGEWVGASLRDVLTLAGIRDNAASVLLIGSGHGIARAGIPPGHSSRKSDAPGYAAGLHPERRTAATRPWLPGASAGSGMGGQQQHQVAGPHRCFL